MCPHQVRQRFSLLPLSHLFKFRMYSNVWMTLLLWQYMKTWFQARSKQTSKSRFLKMRFRILPIFHFFPGANTYGVLVGKFFKISELKKDFE